MGYIHKKKQRVAELQNKPTGLKYLLIKVRMLCGHSRVYITKVINALSC